MKKLLLICVLSILIFAMTACSPQQPEPSVTTPPSDENTLVAYFSCTGNTEKVAEVIAEHIDCATFEIVPEQPYTDSDLDYTDSNSRVCKEQSDALARPAVINLPENAHQYDTVFLGYPVWLGKAPRIILTFLESLDLNGKRIIPFCTSGSTGITGSLEELHSSAANARWEDGTRFGQNFIQTDVTDWVDEMLAINDKGGYTMYIYVNGTRLTATMEDNSSAAALKEKLQQSDITVNMSDYGNFEKVGSLGFSLPRNDESVTTAAGDIILYQGNQITIYYDTNTWNFTRLGKIDNITQSQLTDILGQGNVTVRFSLN